MLFLFYNELRFDVSKDWCEKHQLCSAFSYLSCIF